MQIFSIADSDPVYTLDLVSGTAAIKNFVTKATLQSIPVSQFFDRPLMNTVEVTFGPNGSFDYTIADATTGAQVMHASGTGYTSSGGG